MSQPNKKDAAPAISADDVAHYLKNHPGFFLRHEDLLLELELAHHSGGAVSLLERQVSLLRERNMDMRSRLTNLLDNARSNDQLFERTKAVVLSMLEVKTADALVKTFERSMKTVFGMDFAAATLFGSHSDYPHINSRMVSLDDAYQAIPSLLKSDNPTCGVLRPEETRFLFPDLPAQDIGSAAVVPLSFGYHIGAIAIGSRDPHYFRASMGTLFLGYIAEVMNRLLPPLLDPSDS